MTYAYDLIKKFPRFYQLSLGADIRNTINGLFRILFRCVNRFKKSPAEMIGSLEDAIVEIDFLRRQVRSAYATKCLGPKGYSEWSAMNDEIGRMIGGWYKRMLALIEKEASPHPENARRHQAAVY